MATKLEKYVDDDLITTALMFAGYTQQDIQDRLARSGSVRGVLDSLTASTDDATRHKAGLITGYLNNLGTEHLEKLMVEGAGLSKADVEQSIYWAQQETGGVATPTLDRVLYHLGGITGRTQDQRSVNFAATVRPGLQALGRADAGLMTTRTQYRTGKRPAPTLASGAPMWTDNRAPSGPGARNYSPPPGSPPPPTTPTPPAKSGGIVPAPAGSAAKKAGATDGAGTAAAMMGLDASSLPHPMTPAEAEEVINKKYGYMGALLKDPDIHKILYGVADGSIAPDQFQNQLMATDWYRNQNEAQQAYKMLEATHPSELQAKITSGSDDVKSFAVGMGFTLDDATAKEIATSALSQGWDPTQTRTAVASHYTYQSGKSAVAGVAEQLKTKAADYLTPLSDEAITKWGNQLISGTATMDNFVDYARTQAKAQYPGLGTWLDQDPSRTVKQFVDPYAQQASNILEVPPGQIDFTSPKYQALFGKLDPKTGDRSVMTGPEWASYLKQQPEWQYTSNAHETVANLTATLAKTFGTVG